MALFPKFIIEDGNLIISKVTFHKDIACDIKNVKGGGWFKINNDVHPKTITFHGDSHDFGKAKFEDIKKCVEEKKVFSNKYLTSNLSDLYKFLYDTCTELIELN